MNLKSVAVIGGGVIGAGWLARFVEHGIEVRVFDPGPNAKQAINDVLNNSRYAYAQLSHAPRPDEGRVIDCDTLAEAVMGASYIVESVPERLELKQSVYREIEAHAPNNAIITSSTSGILPSDLQAEMQHPERLMVAHPFNPVYLLPLVELVGGEKTELSYIQSAQDILRGIGMHPLHIKKEIEAFIADRLLEAVWRESLWLVKDGIGTTQDIDDAIRYGFGLRWAQMGLFETYRVAGGEAGMRHFLAQFGPCLSWPWTKLMNVPEFNDELVELIAGQSDEQSGQYTIRELERIRDNNLIGILKALKPQRWGAGQSLLQWEQQRLEAAERPEPAEKLIETFKAQVPVDWADYNGHMNESHYLSCFSHATDALMTMIGADADYVAAGQSFFTVETHIRHLDEALVGDVISVETQVLLGEGKKLQLFHFLKHGDGRLLATGEHMLLHMDLATRKTISMPDDVSSLVGRWVLAHQSLGSPEGVGRNING